MISQESYGLLKLYDHYTNGVMPFAGGLLNQPNLFMDAMTHIGHMRTRATNDRVKKENERR